MDLEENNFGKFVQENKYQICFLSIALLVFWFVLPLLDKFFPTHIEPDPRFEKLYSTEIKEKIQRYDVGTAGVIYIVTTGYPRNYAFLPHGRKFNSIHNTISVGDSILKEGNSDIFILKKDSGKKYEYRFGTYFLEDENSD